MKTENHPIHDVLAKNATSFFIPPFQRAYAWGKPEIERYYNDILRIVGSEMDEKQNDKLEHFFGTLVIKEESEGFANRSVVVDGQQRLTTTLILLIALRDSEKEIKNKDIINNRFLRNDDSCFQDKIKLKQVTKDWDAFRALVNNTDMKPGIVTNAYQLFTRLIKETNENKPDITLEHYIIAIQRMNVAVIFLDERPFKGEDPQIIFETLNSLGKPLTLSDLARNYVLLNMKSILQTKIYEETWHPKIEAILDDKASKFFRDYLQYKTASPIKVVSDNNTKEIYQVFKSFIIDKFDSNTDFINDIVRYTKWYKWIITLENMDSITSDKKKDKQIKELLRNIFHDIKSEAFKPLVLGILEYHQTKKYEVNINDDLLITILESIRTYLIRRRILGLTQGENKNIVTLCKRIEEIAKGKKNTLDLLSNMFYKLRLPNDSEMERELISLNFYKELRKYAKLILGKIEEYNTKVSVDFRNPIITIEHIMPQKLDKSWEKDLGQDYEKIHRKYLHNIGNLILTEFNSEIGNRSFEIKKEKLQNSSLHYRLEITTKDKWNETSIIEHQNNMIKWLLETFHLPEPYNEKDNWITKDGKETTFSPLDIDAGEAAEGNRPIELHINKEVIKVKTWQDVFIQFLKNIKDQNDYQFEYIFENQEELFRKDNAIITWENLKSLIEDKEDLKNRYKDFNGKVCNQINSLTDDWLFIHINISATTCINRIANIMNKFNYSENSVQIILK